MDVAEQAAIALEEVCGALPGGGERRPGQEAMVRRVAESIEAGTHLVVRAGTGTGKSLAYLVPALLSGRTTVVATATQSECVVPDCAGLSIREVMPGSTCSRKQLPVEVMNMTPSTGSATNRRPAGNGREYLSV